jgi:hypothetical protein
MSTTTFIKTTAFSTGNVTPAPPNGTPATDFAEELVPDHEPDLLAVDRTLEPIQEDLNEAADIAMFPSPPMHTPAFSPAPSVVMRPIQRGRGFSVIQDRLAQLTIGHRSIDDEISTARSTAQSVDDGGDDSPIAFSPTGSIPVALGSPAMNPRLSEYLSYSPSNPRSSPKGLDKVMHSQVLAQDGGQNVGVSEKSIWAEEVMGDLERAILRLEQLVDDEEAVGGGGKSAREFYVERLKMVLAASDRKYQVKVEDAN